MISKDLKSTIIFVTHDIDEAILLGERIIILSPNPGRIVENISNKRQTNSGGAEFLELKDCITNSLEINRFSPEYVI